ncbi:MAG: ATP-binding protein [Synechococcales cyanobacterium RM1_1_8]|nr:ATP-binding protein [Synechococcales cyanobacterium RM1_1_8]
MLQSVIDTCVPRPEILAGDLSLDLFAAKLRLVVEGKAPQVYQNPATFLANTFATDGIKTLVNEVFGRLTGKLVGSPIIRLETSFGGGKTHDEIALWHIAKQGREIDGLSRFVDDLEMIPNYPVQVSAIDGRDLDSESGTYHAETGLTTYTLWGEIAYQLGGIDGYQLIKGSDEKRISPGTSVLERLIGDRPTLIILDEIARHLRAAKARKVENSDLAEQVVAFLFSLMDLAASCQNLVLVYSLASASDTFAEETADIKELIRSAARQERVLSPSTDVEVYNIVKQRLFTSISSQAAENAAAEYLGSYRAGRVDLPDGCKDASYAEAIAQSYPFHPELFKLLTQKIASIPEFQRTRGALRLFAQVVRHLWNQPQSWLTMVHPHHLPIGVETEITSDLTSRLQRPLMRLPIQADIFNSTGREAHAQLQDQDWDAAGKPPFSSWVGRTIFLHSLTQGISSGIRRAELNLSLLMPQLEIGFVDQALEKLSSVAWYLDIDPITTISRFKEEPSINKIIAEEKELIGLTQAKDDLRQRRDTIFATKFFTTIAGPDGAHEVSDQADDIALCLIDFNEDMVTSSNDPAPAIVEQIFNNTGESGKFRTFQNRLLFLLANQELLDRAIDQAREYRAIEAILGSANRLDDLSENQQKQLKQKKGEMDLAVRIALTNAYRHLFYPANDPVKAPKGLMHYTLPAQESSTVKGKNNQQDVILKALKDCEKIRPEDSPAYAPAYVLQKVWPSGLDHLTTKAIREAFAKNRGLNILLDAEVSKLRDTIRKGLQEGQWDLKCGNQLYIKTVDAPLALPAALEFSERMELYRRGILEPPKPKEVELSAQVQPGDDVEKTVRVRWRARGALKVALYQAGELLIDDGQPSDEHECKISSTTSFKVVADYGDEGTAEQETRALIYSDGSAIGGGGVGEGSGGTGGFGGSGTLLAKPSQLELSGTPNKAFTDLEDQLKDHQVGKVSRLEISVDEVMDYRKLGTALSLLARFKFEVEQSVRLQTGTQFVDFKSQGDVRGFQGFSNTINGLLNQPETEANVSMTLAFDFTPAIPALASNQLSTELSNLKQALNRNPVDRLSLLVRVEY